MGFDPANTLQMGVGITAFIATIASVFVFSIAYRERVARLLGYSLLFFGLWGWFGFAFYIPENLELARAFRLIAIVFQIVAQIFGILFCAAYLEEYRPLKRSERILSNTLIVGNLFFLLLYVADLLGTTFMAGPLYPNASGLVLAPQPGPLSLWFLAFYVVSALSCGWLLLLRAVHEVGPQRRAAFIFVFSVVASYLMGTTGWLTWYEIESPLAYLRGLAVPAYIVAMFYSIRNYQLLNIRVVASQLFIFILWGFLFLKVMAHESFAAALPDMFILSAVIAVGLVFIRSITQELTAHIELEHLTEKLTTLNTSLDAKVNERTRELSLSREHLESLVAQLPVGLIEVTTQGDVVRANTHARTMIGPCPESTALSQCPALRAHLPLPIRPGIFEITTAEQHTRDIEIVISPLTLDSGAGFAIVMNDVTERRSLERAKDQFIATAAHQLRTPLAALKWVFNLLSESSLPESERSVVESGTKGVEDMERIAEDLMQSARTMSNSGSYQFAPDNIISVVESALLVARPLANKKHIHISFTHDANIPKLTIDAKKLQSAIQNVLNNAITYTPNGGEVSLSLRLENGVSIRIHDTGIGMSQDEVPHAFERFFRGKDATELFANGTGLGLSIAQEIVSTHHGTITLTSERGFGTTVTIVLPLP